VVLYSTAQAWRAQIYRGFTHTISESSDEEEDLSQYQFEDDLEYLRSLDPRDWKDQDHYAVLGMKNLRHRATEDIIKRACIYYIYYIYMKYVYNIYMYICIYIFHIKVIILIRYQATVSIKNIYYDL
jgi:hypothetical protein